MFDESKLLMGSPLMGRCGIHFTGKHTMTDTRP